MSFLSIGASRDRQGTATSFGSSSNYSRNASGAIPPSGGGGTIRLAAFPQDVTLRILSFLPLKSVAQLAACSRRLKVLAYNDVLYERKLRVWFYTPPSSTGNPTVTTVVPATAAAGSVAAASLKPPPLDPENIPLHIRDAWARAAPAIARLNATDVSAAMPSFMNMSTGSSSIGGGGVGTSARTAFRHVHAFLWPLYRAFRAGPTAGAAKILEYPDPVDQTMYFSLAKTFGKAALVDDFKAINANIQSGIQVLESQLLSAFDRHYDANNIQGMQLLAKCLFFLTGGDSCVQMFIYKSPIFFDHVKDVTENFRVLSVVQPAPKRANASAPTSATPSTADSAITSPGGAAASAPLGMLMSADSQQQPGSPGSATTTPLQRYLDTVSATLETQLPLIRTVFPHPSPSQYAFVNKVFDECILDYLTRLLREAEKRDLAVFLASLTHMFEHCSALLRDLADHHALDATRLEEMLHSVLKPFTGEQYMEREVAYLRSEYARALDAWSTGIASRRAAWAARASRGENVKIAVPDPNLGRRVLSGVKSALLTPQALVQRVVFRQGDKYAPTLALTGSPPASPTSAEGPGSGFGPGSPGGGVVSPDGTRQDGFDQLDSLLSVDLVMAMIAQNKVSLKRCVVMMKRSGDVKKHVERLFAILAQTAGEKHIRPSFNIATERLSSYKASEDLEVLPLIQFFAMIQVVDVLLQMVHLYFTEELANYVNLNDFLSDSIQEKKKFEALIDDSVASGLDRAMLTLMSQTEFLLFTEQHPTDFEPPEDIMTDTRPTDACRMSVACLEKHIEMLRACAEKNILNVFLAEVGSRFFTVLSKHIKRQRISVVGGFRLMCDVNSYYAWSESLRNPEVIRMFKGLKELVNIYIVTDLPSLKQLVKEQTRFHGVFRVEDVYEFIECRSDYDKIKSKVKESECTIM
ncbi:exocyst complex component Sec10-domain-containing protein [Blastocladiella britannica]|nr:exocyst complex component Sec10-domain-containing protein [Blastocladiella britannica]